MAALSPKDYLLAIIFVAIKLNDKVTAEQQDEDACG